MRGADTFGTLASMTIQLPPVDPELVAAAALLDADAAASRHGSLAARIDRANELYYVQDAPELSDAEYDQLFRELVALETAREHGHGAIHPFYGVLTAETAPAVIDRARELGIAVNTWTVDDEPEIARLAAAGVNGIVTDVPDVARRLLGAV